MLHAGLRGLCVRFAGWFRVFILAPRVGIRPRVLMVERKKPSRVHRRVLRRFTNTEADPLYQHDKLLSAYAMADWSEEFFNNRAFFSDYYLLERLPDSPACKKAKDDLKPAFNQLSELYLGASGRWAGKREKEDSPDLVIVTNGKIRRL